MRGKLTSISGYFFPHRITPAGAGKTFASVLIEPLGWDHPRRCGENLLLVPCDSAIAGSPPQVRGKRLSILSIARKYRITPAGAGKTAVYQLPLKTDLDHPRRCGENNGRDKDGITIAGSPPQVRGKPQPEDSAASTVGITPAGAGKTPSCTTFAPLVQDHPRRCGENLNYQLLQQELQGSPPQVRGKL